MAQWLRALATLLKDSSSIPRTHIKARDYLQLQSQGIQYPLLTSADTERSWCLDIYTGKGKTVFLRTQRSKPYYFICRNNLMTLENSGYFHQRAGRKCSFFYQLNILEIKHQFNVVFYIQQYCFPWDEKSPTW